MVAGEMAYHGHRVKLHDAKVNTLNSAYDRIEEDKRHLREEGLLPNRNFVVSETMPVFDVVV